MYLIVGAGFSGAVVARQLAEGGNARIVVLDQRGHSGGNCHTERDRETGVMIHCYGPHIFNTDNAEVWSYVQRFGRFIPFVNRVKARTPKGMFSLPINLLTINQFYKATFNPKEAEAFVKSLGDATIGEPRNLEEQALKFIGPELYETFIYGYTKKQWGCEPRELRASILRRLPIRFNYDDNYYSSRYQGIAEDGYSAIVERILDHPGIDVRLSTRFEHGMERDYEHVYFTGAIDAFYGFRLGQLGYRTVAFERIECTGDYQGNAVINYTGMDVPYTRVHEHKHLAPWEVHEKTVAFIETSRRTETNDLPYYPMRREADLKLFEAYWRLALAESKFTFLGRLGTYRYLDMDDVIAEALEVVGRRV